MFATIANGYPRGPLPAQPDRVAAAERGVLAGDFTAADLAEATDAHVREIVAEQVRAGLGFVTDGGARASDRLAPLIAGLTGLEPAGVTHLPSGETVTRPRATGTIAWPGPITLDAWSFVAGLTELPAKQVLIGPYTIGRLLDHEGGEPGRHSLTMALAEALNAELRILAAAGVPVIQVDEDAATLIGDDDTAWAQFAMVGRALTAGLDDDRVHLSFAATGGAVHRAGHAAILEQPYRSVLFDALAGPDAWRFAFAVPPERGVIAGAVDAHHPTYDEIEVMVWAMAFAARDGRGQDRTGIAPNASLALIDRHYARRKCERMGEAIRIARMGPLADVADALDPDPLHSRMPELRALGEAVESARSGTRWAGHSAV